MKCDKNCGDVPHKDVVIIGNGPSGIALSYMLSGNVPYVVSLNHPDEFLSTRLRTALGKRLIDEDLIQLAGDLQGRSNNPVSLLLDALAQPFADIGLDIEPLIEWRSDGKQIDHVVLGRGPPGGSWHSMDPNVLTLSLGKWMALPGFPYENRDGTEKRASAKNVAEYYATYVDRMGLTANFRCGVMVTRVVNLQEQRRLDELMDDDEEAEDVAMAETIDARLSLIDGERATSPKTDDNQRSVACRRAKPCKISTALNYILSRAQQRCRSTIAPSATPCDNKNKNKCCKRRREAATDHSGSGGGGANNKKLIDFDRFRCCQNDNNKSNKDRPLDGGCRNDGSDATSRLLSDRTNLYELYCHKNNNCDDCHGNQTTRNHHRQLRAGRSKKRRQQRATANWYVEAYDVTRRTCIAYTCDYLVLANGSSDRPNKLATTTTIANGGNRAYDEEPDWLLYDVRSLEIELDLYAQQRQLTTCDGNQMDPVLIVGAGLSAADAVITARARNVPVLHAFRNSNNRAADLSRQLPENMYPEYHKVHQMMKDGGSAYPLYKALPDHAVVAFDGNARAVTLRSPSGDHVKCDVSFVAVLIGSRPDLCFLPETIDLGTKDRDAIDCKSNAIVIDKRTHLVGDREDLYAIGPLAGDRFVRFLPGGALAVVADLYRKMAQRCER